MDYIHSVDHNTWVLRNHVLCYKQKCSPLLEFLYYAACRNLGCIHEQQGLTYNNTELASKMDWLAFGQLN
jgi:hypothetical protein